MRWSLLVLTVVAVTGLAGWWYLNRPPDVTGVAFGNGRLEAEEIDIATKIAGNINEILVDEGQDVTTGQILVVMDSEELEADARRVRAELAQAREARREAAAVYEQRQVECDFAEQELARTLALLAKGHVSIEFADRRRTEKDSAEQACIGAGARLAAMEQAIAAAAAGVERIDSLLDDTVIRAPRDGRVQFRLREPGEVLAVGGKILTLIDLNDMCMTFFLPTIDVGRVTLGADARIVVDALPEAPIAARISFVADEAQFTPKQVETRTERERLVFRVKAQVTGAADARLKPGMPGLAYVRHNESVPWPDGLN